jgi:hypothetical protein
MPMSPIRRFYLAKLGWLAFVAPIPLFAVSMDQRLATFSLVAAILVGVCGELYCLWMLRCPTCDSPIAHRGRLYPGNGPERFARYAGAIWPSAEIAVRYPAVETGGSSIVMPRRAMRQVPSCSARSKA